MSKIALVLCVVAVTLSNVCAVSEEEKAAFKEALQPVITECSQTHGVSSDDINAAKTAGNADTINPCFLGCVFKKTEVINEKGEYDVDKGLEKLKSYVKSDGDLAKFGEIGKQCASVNDQAVSDAEAGCERAKLLLSCFLEHKAELPL